MPLIDIYTIKVISEIGTGTGFILFPETYPDNMYIITARHILIDKKNPIIKRDKINIAFSEKAAPYQLQQSDKVYLGNDNQTEDCAIIILPINILTNAIDCKDAPTPIKLTGKETKCLVSGYSKIANNIAIRTLYLCRFLSDADYNDEIQIEVSDPVTEQYNSDDLVEGYSGSPIFMFIDDHLYVAGIFLGYEPVTQRITGLNITFVNTLLTRNQNDCLIINSRETNEVILADLKKIDRNSERILNRIKNNIGGLHISRPTLEKKLKEAICKQTLTVVFGKPGIGKSAITKKALSDLRDYSIISLQGEQLDKLSIQEVFNSSTIGIDTNINDLLSSPGFTAKKLIFIDSIEKLLETHNAETIIDFFSLLKDRDDLTLVMTCRSYAIEQLKIRFLQQFQDFYDFEVPILNDEELSTTVDRYPFLNNLLLNSSLKRILQIPFNLDKATLIHQTAFNATINNEQDFKRLMWDYVIEGKETESNYVNRKLRGEIFSKIAYNRAKSMSPYVQIQTEHQHIIYDLQKDQIIETDTFLNDRYAPSHDIYEDWALTRKIEIDFQNYLSIPLIAYFFCAIGSAPAIRRAFRIWISEKLQVIDFNIKELILSALGDQQLERHWKDEILIAIMQSAYSKEFLYTYKDFLFENTFFLFKRCVLLLRVACQSPDFSYLALLKPEQKNYIYHNTYLKPYGEGWANMINFMYEHLGELTAQYKTVIQTIFQWEKSLDFGSELPTEAKSAALILYKYFEHYLEHSTDQDFRSIDSDEIVTGIKLLFKLAKLIPKEVENILFPLTKEKERGNYKINGFWDKVREIALSWENSYPVCQLFPEIIIAIAEKEWLYFEPSEDELKERYGKSPLGYLPRLIDTDEKFGVVDHNRYKYYPSSAFQTPIWHLLRIKPVPTLDFIIRLFNHSTNTFFKSDFLMQKDSMWPDDERSTFQLDLPGDLVSEVHGSQLLWTIYRGLYNITSPSLLQSVLMALEKWMLDMANGITKDKENKYPVRRKNFEYVFNLLLQETRSVSIIAVLISIATAEHELCKKIVQPLLKARMFYKWDLVRCAHERRNRYMSYNDGILIKTERKQSDELAHHSMDMEMLIRKLTFTTERNAIYAILDQFYAENPTDEKWKLALNRMDLRKAEIVNETENGYILMPKIDEDLKPIVAESERAQEEVLPVKIAGNWALQKWDDQEVEDSSYQEWQKHYRAIVKANTSNKQSQLFRQPGTIAAIGIRDYFGELSNIEQQWCIKQIFGIVECEIKGSHQYFGDENDGSYSAFDPDHAFRVLVILVDKCEGEQKSWAKELLFASLLFIHNELHRKKIIDAIQKDLWTTDSDFALNCVAGLLNYAKFAELRNRIMHFHPGLRFQSLPSWKKNKFINWITRSKNKLLGLIQKNAILVKKRKAADEALRQRWIDEYNEKVEKIINDVVRAKVPFNYKEYDNIKFYPHYLVEALTIVPYDNNSEEIKTYYSFIIGYLLNNIVREDINRQEKIHFSLQQTFAKSFANFLLRQSPDNALELFRKLSDCILIDKKKSVYYNDKRLTLVKDTLKEMLWIVYHQASALASFWAIWEYLFSKVGLGTTDFFNKILLLNPGYLVTETWEGLTGKKNFYKNVIKKLNDIDETVRLIVGAGFDELMPEGIVWYASLIKDTELRDNNTIYLSDQLVINTYYNKELRDIVKSNTVLKQSFMLILDKLIDQNSSSAFLIREDFISIK